MTACKEETIKVRGRNVKLFRGGDGPPLVFLHDPFCPSWLPIHEKLAAHHDVIVPVPAADVLSLDGPGMRQVMFSDPASALALETLPDTPKAEDMVGTILARRTLARFAWQFPDNPRLRRYLYRVRVPTLITWGERDGFVAVAHGKAYQEEIAGSQLVTIPNAGHLPHVETAESCAQIMENFLRKEDA